MISSSKAVVVRVGDKVGWEDGMVGGDRGKEIGFDQNAASKKA